MDWFNPGVAVLGARLEAPSGNATTMEEALVEPSRATLVLEVVIVLMSLGAVAGNILVIVIVAATKTFHSVASVLIINLAVSDLLVGVGVMPFVAVSIINSSWVNSSFLCLYVGYTSSVYCTASVLTLAAIALDRYYSIMDCLRYSARCTVCRTCAVVLWIWLQALATSGPPLLGWSAVVYVGPMFSCAVDWTHSPSYTALVAALSFLLPASVILFCYVNIVRVARRHARRIHTLEAHLRRRGSRGPASEASSSSSSSSPSTGARRHAPSRLVYHLSASFVSEVRGGDAAGSSPPGSSSPPTPQTSPPQQQPPLPQHQQHHNHGVIRLFLVIAVFFLCWTPYMGVALVQATEAALRGKSGLVPPTAVTFSYWLVLLNSDINPLLYALLSKRFQGALRNLRQKIRARLGAAVWKGGENRSCEPCSTTTVTNIRAPGSASESWPSRDGASRHCSSVFTVNADFKHHHQPKQSGLPGSASSSSSSSSLWRQECGGGEGRVDCLKASPSAMLVMKGH
ncbi:hypothetical protein NHX12_022197 [Muraenolepis orangiensis]|uniref:G-protein coupled receptors family 1 profile domain-containing protein n=1 Tax=Muraenolepis orangiensis TaxID=630683 RepID=A0A9Q0EPE2_9TELE|nr:hypothetical protein NHX12_022197 [Muraenolepis orangiensis]